MREATAFAPGHITGFFQSHIDPGSLLATGSRGAGVALAKGVRTRVRLEPAEAVRVSVFFNQLPAPEAEVSFRTLSLFLAETGIREPFAFTVLHEIGIPVGCGFGSSGAGALSLVFALNKVLAAGLDFYQAVRIAHCAEVQLKTGLGTVMGEAYGGMVIREKAGAPGYGRISRINIAPDYQVACLLFGSMATPGLLSDPGLHEKINRYGAGLVERISGERSVVHFMQMAREFALQTGLFLPDLQQIAQKLARAGILASMLMFGNGIFLIEQGERLKQAVELLHEYESTAEILVSEIDFQGVRVL